jgi:YesN/AraC family two-component response regulator
LTDLIMPEKEGLETIGSLRRLYPQLRIIAMSGGGRGNAMDYLRTASMMGAKQTLVKPFSSEELRKALEVAQQSENIPPPSKPAAE